MKLSNGLIGLLNILTIIISLPFIVAGVLSSSTISECARFFQSPFMAFGVFLLVVSLVGLVGACCRSNLLMWLYLFVMFLLIVGLLAFTAFMFVVTNKGSGEAINGMDYLEYRLPVYSKWLQKAVTGEKNWNKIVACLRASKICQVLASDYNSELDFYKAKLTPSESGCCKPPTQCGYIYQNATYWKPPTFKLAPTKDTDCQSWSNDQDVLCYNCNSCRAGVLANVKIQWKKLAVFSVVLLVFLTIIYSVGCCALRNNKANRYQQYTDYR